MYAYTKAIRSMLVVVICDETQNDKHHSEALTKQHDANKDRCGRDLDISCGFISIIIYNQMPREKNIDWEFIHDPVFECD